ncbi:MAG: copper amine oxidase [Acidimicrobiales bacterium]
MNRTMMKIGAGIAVAALLGAACGDDDGDVTAGTEDTEVTVGNDDDGMAGGDAVSVETGAAELRSGLTSLLQEHVFLAGAAISTAVQAGGDLESPAVASAVSTLDANSIALSNAVASVYGDDAGEQFLELWRSHIGFFVDYTLGGATGDTAKQDAAKQKLDDYRADFGAFIDGATGGELPADTVADNLQVHVNTLVEAIDSVLAGTPDVYTKLKAAADHMPSTAAALAGAIVTQMPDKFDGDSASGAAELRAGLTHLLQEHVYLAGLAVNQAVADGGDLAAPATSDAVAALDANSVELSDAITSVYGDEAGEQFLELWRNHIGFFVEYTLGGATGDTAKQDAAKQKLDDYRADFGAFIDSATGGELPADTVADNLQVHVNTLVEAIDSILAGSPEVFPKLQAAAQHMPSTALALSSAIVTQFPEKFAG